MLCHCCRDIDLDKLLLKDGMQHHVSMEALKKSAEDGCELCKILMDAFGLNPLPHVPQFSDYPWPVGSQISCRAVKFSTSEVPPHAFSALQFSTTEHPVADGAAKYPEGKPLVVQFGCFVEPDNPLSKLISGRPLLSSSRSDSAFQTASKWMQECLKDHRLCYNASNALPSRLIDVGKHDADEVRLVICDGHRGQWVILSHCWGSQRHGITTTENMEDRQRRIDVDSLPILYQDAIAITRKLGYQYLWIDSLCIIQDSLLDWRLESLQMDSYYSGAVLNISAVAASSSSEGIFSSSDDRRDRSKPILTVNCSSTLHHIEGRMQIWKPTAHSEAAFEIDYPLYQRAWVLQEYVLSPRILEYCTGQLRWQCNTQMLNEQQPESNGLRDRRIPYMKLLATFEREEFPSSEFDTGNHLPRGDHKGGETPLSWWYFIVNDYMSRIMRFPDDRLPGIAGLAKEFAARTGLTYMCGLWKENVARGLGWNAYGTKCKTDLLTAPPSWSWASLIAVRFVASRRHGRLYSQGQYLPMNEPELVGISIVNENDDIFGQVKSARLTLAGKWLSVAHTPSPPAFSPSQLGMDLNTVSTLSVSLKFQPEQIVCSLDEPPGPDGYTQEALHTGTIYFHLGRWKSDYFQLNDLHSDGILHALILEPVDGENVYKRIGIAEVPDEAVNATEWETGTVVIV